VLGIIVRATTSYDEQENLVELTGALDMVARFKQKEATGIGSIELDR
jgi:hypothetical protein